MKFDYSCLVSLRRRGFRNGNWRRLPFVDRALFRCALWVAKVRGRIVSLELLVRVLAEQGLRYDVTVMPSRRRPGGRRPAVFYRK